MKEKEGGKLKKKPGVTAYILRMTMKKRPVLVILYLVFFAVISYLLWFISKESGNLIDMFYAGEEGTIQLNSLVSIGVIMTYTVILIVDEIVMIPLFARMSSNIAAQCRQDFVWSSLNLPLDDYQSHSDGYLMESEGHAIDVSHFLSKQIVELVFRPLVTIFFMVSIFQSSVPMGIVVLASFLLMVLISFLFSEYQNRRGKELFEKNSVASGFLLDGIKAINSVRNSGAEFIFFRQYVGLNRECSRKSYGVKRMQEILDIIPLTVGNITKLFLVFVGIYNVYQGNMVLAALIFIYGIYCVIQGYISSTLRNVQDVFSIRYEFENLAEISERARENLENTGEDFDENKIYDKLKGNIQVKNVSFGYNRETGKVLDGVSLDITAGSYVAIVGASGSGKTTLKKMICGRYEPWEGEILFDGTPIKEIPPCVMEGSISTVDQQIIMFEDTVMNNIKMWDDSQLDADAILAAKDAHVYNQIVEREKGFYYRVSEDGGNFSGGERQRIEIARALSMEPSIIIMDEATSALDTIVEKRVTDSVRARGITTIIIAHRLSTIRNCDKIFVLDQGRIISSGTHEELMENCELYNQLVTVE